MVTVYHEHSDVPVDQRENRDCWLQPMPMAVIGIGRDGQHEVGVCVSCVSFSLYHLTGRCTHKTLAFRGCWLKRGVLLELPWSLT